MKIFLCLLLIKVCSCIDSEQSASYWRGIGYDHDRNYGYYQQGPIQRPCSLHDVNCIKRYFAHNSQCIPVQGLAPDPLRIKIIPMSVSHVNITFTLYDVDVKGFNEFRVKEFYINQATGRLVLEIEFHKLDIYSPFTVIVFHRKGKEPLELSDYGFIEYRDISLTLTAPQDKGIDLSEGRVFTYISDANPKQGLGTNFTESKDPQVQIVIKSLIERIGLSLQEAFVTKGPILMSNFLQKAICSY